MPNRSRGLDAVNFILWKKFGLPTDIKKPSGLLVNDSLDSVGKIVDYFEEDPPERSIHIVIYASSKWRVSF